MVSDINGLNKSKQFMARRKHSYDPLDPVYTLSSTKNEPVTIGPIDRNKSYLKQLNSPKR